MFEYIQGKITELTPTYLVIDAGGIGYHVNISLYTFGQLQEHNEMKLFLHQVVREDAHLLYGFSTLNERGVFRMLISVSGIGPNTARMMLSSMTPGEIKIAITEGNVNVLKRIKGIGAKSAQRVIVDLQDKMVKGTEEVQLLNTANNTIKNEALSALEILGFSKKQSEKVIDGIISESPDTSVEDLIKKALKKL
jgi:holliday junction DNA helicase RuvA